MQDNAGIERRAHANSAQKFARKVSKIPEIRHVSRTKNCKHSASVRRAYCTASLRLDRVSIAFRSEKESVQHWDHANFAPNSRERIAKFPKKFGAPRAQNFRGLGRRGCASLRISLQLFSESAYALTQDNARIQRRDDANVAQKSEKAREKFAKFPEIRHAPHTKKMRALGQRALRIFHNVAESLSSHNCIQIRKRNRPASGSRKFCAELARKKFQRFRKNFGAPRAQKLRELGQRDCANHRTCLLYTSPSPRD